MPYIMGGPLYPDNYIFESVHINHWGGSPHCEVNPLKLLVLVFHYNAKYGSFILARQQPDGLAVVIFHIDMNYMATCPEFKDIIDTLPNLKQPYSSAIINGGKT